MKRNFAAVNIALLRSRKMSGSMHKTFSLIVIPFVLCLAIPGAAQPSNKTRSKTAIRAVLDAQAAAWNRGDVDGYMDGYDRSPNTEFVSGDTITRGWQQVLDRYKQRYDTRDKMGVLTFSDLEIIVLSNDAALALGRWRLQRLVAPSLRTNGEPHGTFTLLFRKTKVGWRIVHDHTSSA